ncbi:hypothetical protein CEUSTIGMA_g3093.t1 [Chlamydomonas eustigma]|uniref:Uncharacterized protein n=1 Tax=Chlamydomonas eustigma TaxID=1157962 RepID=A0A250WY79_9CHLO|nr:hypothetical protein CEUSTIGMA_g3093.t1 [Chlamydomonas eustigma]|eukprot:GAX75649.1 hypothetical protein CEUSTIGMA_g3093.t1 [Chlamydomonas eustigma]
MADNGSAGQALAMRQEFQAILEAVQAGNAESLKTLTKMFNKIELMELRDSQGRTILHHAAQQGHTSICKHMIEEIQMFSNTQDKNGETPLALACATGRVETVSYLLSKGASHSLRNEPEGTSPMHRAANCTSTEVMQVLIQAGASVNMNSRTGTPLCWAAGAGLAENVEFLIKHGAEVNPQAGSSDMGALTLAAACGSLRSVELLLAAGGDATHICRGGATALHAAAAVNHESSASMSVEIAKRLLEAGANPNAADEAGLTPLTIAASRPCQPLVQLLLPLTQPGSGKLENASEWTEVYVIQAAQEYVQRLKDQKLQASGMAALAAKVPSISDQEEVAIPEPPEPDEIKAAEFKRSGDQAFVKGDNAVAVEQYSKSLRHATRNSVVWANRSMAYLRAGDALMALSDARISRALDPTYVKAWYREGCAYAALKRWEDAALAFFEGSNLDPKNQDIAKAFKNAIAEGRREASAAKALHG